MSTRLGLLLYVAFLLAGAAIVFSGSNQRAYTDVPLSEFPRDLQSGAVADATFDSQSHWLVWEVGGQMKRAAAPDDAIADFRAQGNVIAVGDVGETPSSNIMLGAFGFILLFVGVGVPLSLAVDASQIAENASRVVWILAVLLLSVFGVIAYLATRRRIGRRSTVVMAVAGAVAIGAGLLFALTATHPPVLDELQALRVQDDACC